MPNPTHPIVGPEDYLSPYNDINYSKGPKIIYGDIDVFTVVLNDAQSDDDDEWGRTEQIALRMVIDEAIAVHKELFGWSDIFGLKQKFDVLAGMFVGLGPAFDDPNSCVFTIGGTELQDGLLTVGAGAFLSSDNVGLSLSNGNFTVETNPLTLVTTIEAANISNTTSIILGPANTGSKITLDVKGVPYIFTETSLTLPGALQAGTFSVANATIAAATINSLITPSITIQKYMGEPSAAVGINIAAGSEDNDPGSTYYYGLIFTGIGGSDGVILKEQGIYILGDSTNSPKIEITYEGIRLYGYDNPDEYLASISYGALTLKSDTAGDLFSASDNGIFWYNMDQVLIFKVEETGTTAYLGLSIINTVVADPEPILVYMNFAASREDYNGGDYFYGLVLTGSDGAKNLILKDVDLMILGEDITTRQIRISKDSIDFYHYEIYGSPLLTLNTDGITLQTDTETPLFHVGIDDFSYYDRDSLKLFNVDDETGLAIRISGNAYEFVASPLGIKLRSIAEPVDVIFFQATTTKIQLFGHDGIISVFTAQAGLLEVAADSEELPIVLRADTHGVSTGYTSLKWKTVIIPSVTWPASTEVFPYNISGSHVLYGEGEGPSLTNIRNVVIDLFDSDGSAVNVGYAFGTISKPSSYEINLGAYKAITDGDIDVRVQVTIFYTE